MCDDFTLNELTNKWQLEKEYLDGIYVSYLNTYTVDILKSLYKYRNCRRWYYMLIAS